MIIKNLGLGGKYKIKPVLEHIYGHQDDHKPYEDLSLKAQLNVDADTEVGTYQHDHPAHRPHIPHLPHNRAQLHISGQVILSKLKHSGGIHGSYVHGLPTATEPLDPTVSRHHPLDSVSSGHWSIPYSAQSDYQTLQRPVTHGTMSESIRFLNDSSLHALW
jgi:hypothetical protein